eukprot:3353969-Prymnesium_polylepis.1
MQAMIDADEVLWQSALGPACERAFSLTATVKAPIPPEEGGEAEAPPEGAGEGEPTIDREAFWPLL